MRQIYLDYNASTPIAPEVADAMSPFLAGQYGNPSSGHWAGAPAKQVVEKARKKVAAMLDCAAEEIVFTSGGTEANNHAIKGVFFSPGRKGNHIITTQVEHPAVLQPCRFLERFGAEVTYLPVDSTGRVEPVTERLPNTLNVSFAGRIGSQVLEALEGVAASTGSACHSGRHELSPVLKAMGVPESLGFGAVRFSFGRWTMTQELDHVLDLLRSRVLTRQAA